MDEISRRIMMERALECLARRSAAVGDLRRAIRAIESPLPPDVSAEVLDLVARLAVEELVEVDDLLTGVALAATADSTPRRP